MEITSQGYILQKLPYVAIPFCGDYLNNDDAL